MVLAFRRPRLVGAGAQDIAARLRARLMRAKLRECVLRPAALTGHAVLHRRPLRLLLAKLARRQARLKCAESPKPYA
ncbi:hypothetical protein S23_37170 [Bradyrhizobium cosmicum]|uniref:Uncharacterized protein n=1 Tax=Bradyrhizobium cosmicum TaxID=1404864 RepID=A0AAI8QCY9_9BRAD|nr:hypothetical protein S23_37170 [Bradyrhizobium cosmicum]